MKNEEPDFFSNEARPTESQSASFWRTAHICVSRFYDDVWGRRGSALAPAVHSACIMNFIDSPSRKRNPAASKNCDVTFDPLSIPLSTKGDWK